MRATFTLDANNRLCLDHQPESPEEELLLRLWRASSDDGGQLARARALLEKLLAREVSDLAEGIEALSDLRRATIRRLEQDVAEAADEAEPAGPAEAPTDRPRRNQVTASGREKMRLHARPSPESMRAMRDLAAKGRSAEEIAAREWVSAAGTERRFGVPIIKNILRGGGDQATADEADEDPAPARRPPPHPDCRGVLAVIEEPAWLRPGSRIPMPSYAGSWAFPTRNPNSCNA
jgi:hypothetical protein